MLPADAIEFLRRPQHAVIGWSGRNGRPYTVATWYDWDDGQILINMDAGRKRRAWLQVGAPVSLTVLEAENWYRHLSLYGEIARTCDDAELADIDRLAQRYTSGAYRNRAAPRVSAWIEIDSWHGWIDGKPWPSDITRS
jgi:nitroimidazol reductase NimA-like FMN-containing flavoprotein (pyridoxamine 5'-phosphate oxidase superfamily)